MSLYYFLVLSILLFFINLDIFSQESNVQLLPIIKIETNGQQISDEPKIDATLQLFPNGNFTDSANLTIAIGIELRGQTSRLYNRKKQYGFETRNGDGTNLNISLLNMPEENDWILAAPYDDKTLIRDVLCFNFYSQMGWYAPRTRFCTLYLNSCYQGIYVLTEKIKVDKNRIDLKKQGPNSFIFETSVKEKLMSGECYFTTDYSSKIQIIIYPKNPSSNDSIKGKQLFNLFENIIFSKEYSTNSLSRLDSVINIQAFIDYILLNETVRNVDAFHASTYWSYQEGGKLTIGPPWDHNISMGNTNNQENWKYTGLHVLERSYPQQLKRNINFKQNLFDRWSVLRSTVFSTDNVINLIDSLTNIVNEEVPENFEKWNILGKYVWPNHFIGKTYQEEINNLKSWLINRLNWLDYAFGRTSFFVEYVSASSNSVKVIVHNNTLPWKFDLIDNTGSVISTKSFQGTDSVFIAKRLTGHEAHLYSITVGNNSLPVNNQKTVCF